MIHYGRPPSKDSVTENGTSHINTYETETTKAENQMHKVFCSLKQN